MFGTYPFFVKESSHGWKSTVVWHRFSRKGFQFLELGLRLGLGGNISAGLFNPRTRTHIVVLTYSFQTKIYPSAS